MKTPATHRLVRTGTLAARSFAGAVATLLAVHAAQAANGIWTLDGSGLWSATSNWSGATVADGSGATADFSTIDITADRTVSLDSPRTIGSLSFGDTTVGSAGGWLLDSSNGGNVLTLAGGTPTITVNALDAGKVAAISAGITGASGLTKAGAGTLVLAGVNTYTSTTTVSAGGILNIQNTNALGTDASGTTVASGGALEIQGNIFTLKEALTLNDTGLSNGGALRNISGANVYNGAVTLASSARIHSDSGVLTFQNPSNTITLGANTLTFGGAGTTSVLTAITGTGAVTKEGTGTFGNFAASTYTGTTNVNGGNLLLGIAENVNVSGPLGKQLAAATGSIVFGGGTLQYSPQNSTDYSGRFSTAASQPIRIDTNSRSVTFATALTSAGGTLTKIGAGTLTLSNTGNTYDGGTTVSGGTLAIAGAALPGSGTLTVSGGGNLNLADGTALATTLGGLTLSSAATVTLDWNASAVDTLTTAAAATTSGNVAIALNPTNTPVGSGLTLISAASGLSGARYFLANNTNYTATLDTTSTPDTAITVGSYAAVSQLTSAYWTGGILAGALNAMALSDGAAGNWSTTTPATYTATGLVPGATANVFFNPDETQQSNMVLGANMSVNSLTFNDPTPVTLASDGSYLTLNSTGTGTASAISVNEDATINANLILAGSQTVTTASGKTLVLGGNVAGTGSLTKAGSGTVTLTSASTYGGTTTVSGGTLNYNSTSTKPYATLLTGNTAAFTAKNGTINVGGFVDIARMDINTNGVINVTGGTLLTRNAKANGSGVFVGTGSYGMLHVSSGAVNIAGNLGGNGQEDGRIDIGNGGTGLLRITGGSMSVGNGIFMSGNGSAGNAELTITHGALKHGGVNRDQEGYFYVTNNGGLSVVNVAGGLLDNNQNKLMIAKSGGTAGSSTAVVNLNAGTLLTRDLTQGGNNMAIIAFNGGTLRVGAGSSATTYTPTPAATSSFSAYVNGAFGTFAGGAVIDTNGNTTAITSALQAPTGSGVTGIEVTAGGSGYVGAPFVTLSDSGATGITGTTTSASKVISNVSSTANIHVGQSITGTGIPLGSIVTAVDALGGTITISQNATAAGSPTLTVKGAGATAYATIASGAVTGLVVTNPGVGYVGTVSAILTGGFTSDGIAATVGAVTIAPNTSGGLTKLGSGTLTLSGVNTYTGDTTVSAGTLTLTSPNTSNETSIVTIAEAGAFLNLNFVGTDTVGKLFIGATPMAPGTYGATGSADPIIGIARITGSGTLTVSGASSAYAVWATGNAGSQGPELDYDHDGVSNGVEYFMGQTGSSFTPNPAIESTGKIAWPKDPTANASYVVQISSNLMEEGTPGDGGWTTATSGVVDNGTSVEYTPPTGGQRLFVRLKVTIP